MSDYKHVYAAINNTLHHIKQAQELCDDLKEIDKESCGSWKKELKGIEKQLNGCFKTVESKHKKAAGTMRKKTASYEEEMMNEDWDMDRDDEDDDYDYNHHNNMPAFRPSSELSHGLMAASKSRLKKFADQYNSNAFRDLSEHHRMMIEKGYQRGLTHDQIAYAAKSGLDAYRAWALITGMLKGITNNQAEIISNIRFNEEQMRELISLCTFNKVSDDILREVADPSLDWQQMDKKAKELQKNQ